MLHNLASCLSLYNISYNLAPGEITKNKNTCRLELNLYVTLRAERIKCSHASRTKKRPV